MLTPDAKKRKKSLLDGIRKPPVAFLGPKGRGPAGSGPPMHVDPKRPGGLPKPPVDYTLPENKGLVKANTPERKAAVLSEISKIKTLPGTSRGKLGQRANLIREAKKYGWM